MEYLASQRPKSLGIRVFGTMARKPPDCQAPQWPEGHKK